MNKSIAFLPLIFIVSNSILLDNSKLRPDIKFLNIEKFITFQEDPIFEVVDTFPEFKGGTMAMYQYIKQNITYPSEAMKANKAGKVVLWFVVEKDGKISKTIIKKSIGYGMDEEAKRIIESMPPWLPGLINKQAVRTYVKMPIFFYLNK